MVVAICTDEGQATVCMFVTDKLGSFRVYPSRDTCILNQHDSGSALHNSFASTAC